MSKGYIFEDGELVEEQECSVDDVDKRYCKKCGKETTHFLDCISSRTGKIYKCFVCGTEN